MALDINADLFKVEKVTGVKAKVTAQTMATALGLTPTTVVDNLNSSSSTDALSAGQGQALRDLINGIGNTEYVATIAARDAFADVDQGDVFFVADNGSGIWARYQASTAGATGAAATWVEVQNENALNAGLSATNLGYTAAPTGGTVTNTTGGNATLPLADGINAGLLAPGDFSKLGSLSATPTAADLANVPSGNLAGTTVQTALNELQGDIDTLSAAAHVGVTLAANTGFVLTGQEITNSFAALPDA